jgi:hypothetical protein
MELVEFLIKAKLHGYASAGERNETTLDDGGKQLTYSEGPYQYRDRYFGFNPFIGEEVVWQDGRIVWGMNFYGAVLDETISAGAMYRFLQQAMRQVQPDRPYRGPEYFRTGDWEYCDASRGTVERFTGVETIRYQGREVYRLEYQGGAVK